ncbi:two component transcriptional regulator, LuxR family [Arsukibacterium tuosuense]|uniref:Two component transcriptional regulator, LuxR family n=1 Tax=Arsukibacterium tuosuense TaxID=1323745 RepID=A0A285ITL0_9GAMM|nr:response regulator transcription factor [Arsukibacterium tuosuense]SNY51328.1 two component transcriptional regulator, LuxR family [Arsukibacterium tuosuense]
MSNILLIDDHPVFRCGLIALIQAEPDLKVCGEAATVADGLRLIQQLKPDMLILDLVLEQGDGLQLLKHLRAQGSTLPILVMSMYDEQLFAERVIKAGANGYINKADAISNVIVAIRRVLQKRLYLSDTMTETLLHNQFNQKPNQSGNGEDKLSDRELEVYMMLGKGYATKRIAEELNLSSKTVDSHKEHIKEKLAIADNTSLIQHAVTWLLTK